MVVRFGFVFLENLCNYIVKTNTISPCIVCVVPSRPADVKAVPAASNQILVAWRPPLYPNGIILRYTIHMMDMSIGEVRIIKHNFHVS